MDGVYHFNGFSFVYCCISMMPLLFCLVWGLPEILQLVSDLITGDDPLARTERDRELEGHLFDPQYRPRPGEPLVWRKPSRIGFPEFPFQHHWDFL